MPEIKLPKGLKLGDPITSDGELLGHVTEGGTIATLLIEGNEYYVPMVMDGEYTQELMSRNLPDNTEIPVRIGGRFATNIALKDRRVRPNPIGMVLDEIDRERLKRSDAVYASIAAAKEEVERRQSSIAAQIEAAKVEARSLNETFQRKPFHENIGGQCDFCDEPVSAWDYPCEDFEMLTPDEQPFASDGAWAACDLCAQAVERNDRLTLANRYLKSKPEEFRDLLQPWTLRLHNQFYRHRTGPRVRHVDYDVVRDTPSGSIAVLSAEDPNAAAAFDGGAEIAEYVRQTGEPAMVTVDADGTSRIVTVGQSNVEGQIERRQLVNRYLGHPLMDRYYQHMKSMQARQGLWRNSEPWHALAEKYIVTLGVANSMGNPEWDGQPGSFYVDPEIIAAWPAKQTVGGLGLYLARALHGAVPYLWMSRVDELANGPDLPPHRVTRNLVPHPAMFWSFESAFGPKNARIDWMLVLEAARGYEVWFPLANDVTRDGKVMISGCLVAYGAKWPDDLLGPDGKQGVPEFLLKRLSFLNSKYVEAPHVRLHRYIRRDVQRTMKKQHLPMPDDLGVYVIHLRQPEARPKPSSVDDGNVRNFVRQHCWWRRAHNRVIYRDTNKERATWVKATLMGDTNLPLIRTTIVVDH